MSRYEGRGEGAEEGEVEKEGKGEGGEGRLKQAYTNLAYLRLRQQQLGLLERWGGNVWVVGNEGLEVVLRGCERELLEVRGKVEGVNKLVSFFPFLFFGFLGGRGFWEGRKGGKGICCVCANVVSFVVGRGRLRRRVGGGRWRVGRRLFGRGLEGWVRLGVLWRG